MRYCENEKCSKPLVPKVYKNRDGYQRTEHISKFNTRTCCDLKCKAELSRQRAAQALIEAREAIGTHNCWICGNPVPWVTKNGKVVEIANYPSKRTCNDPECYKALRKQTSEVKCGKRGAIQYHESPDLLEQWTLGAFRAMA